MRGGVIPYISDGANVISDTMTTRDREPNAKHLNSGVRNKGFSAYVVYGINY